MTVQAYDTPKVAEAEEQNAPFPTALREGRLEGNVTGDNDLPYTLPAFIEEEPSLPSEANLNGDVTVLFSPEQIAQRVTELSTQIVQDYAKTGMSVCLVGMLPEATLFVADLTRAIGEQLSLELQYLDIAQFRAAQQVPFSVAGKQVLLVDTLMHTGQTLNAVINALYQQCPRKIKACVLVNKLQERCIPVPEVRYTGFQVEAGWIVGYGMDQHAHFRNLPYIGVSTSHK